MSPQDADLPGGCTSKMVDARMDSPEVELAYEKGLEAYLAKQDRDEDNPYCPRGETAQYDAWRDGYDDMMRSDVMGPKENKEAGHGEGRCA